MIYFIYEPDGWGDLLKTFDDEKSWIDAVENFDFMADYCDDVWSTSVENVVAGIAPRLWDESLDGENESDFYEKHATHHTAKVNERARPDDVNDDGFDQDGEFWGEWDYICGYAFELIKDKKTPAGGAG